MQAICNNCDHWDANAQLPTQATDAKLGTCEELSNSGMKYVLPIVDSHVEKNARIVTEADFGCNHFEAAAKA